jgi:hypothetical protein
MRRAVVCGSDPATPGEPGIGIEVARWLSDVVQAGGVGSDTWATEVVPNPAGFVGSHACKALSRAGYLPVAFDKLERGHERAVKWGPLERGDLRNENDIACVFEARQPWAVMHFAAYAYVGESTSDPAGYYDNNVGGSSKLLRACAAFGCRHIVFSSSCATYGIPERLPLKEDAPQNPVNPYGQADQTPRTKSNRYAGGPHRRAVHIRKGGDGAVQRINDRHSLSCR